VEVFMAGQLKRLTIVAFAVLLTPAPVWSQSAKSAVQVSSLELISPRAGTGGWVTILGNQDPSAADRVLIHTSEQKDLIFGASFECGLYTSTRAKSSGGTEDNEYAAAGVRVRVLVDPGTPWQRVAEPGSDPTDDGEDNSGVTYCYRKQSLSAQLQGIIGNQLCFPGGVFDPTAPGCLLTDEQIELILETTDAAAFFFVLPNLGAGTHNIIVQARIDTAVSSSDSNARALVGRGALVVEEVRLVKDGVIFK